MDEIVPRLSHSELALFKRGIDGKNSYLEFGCGGSTVVAVQTELQRMFSVESDKDWIERLKQHEAISAAIAAGRLILHHADVGPVRDWGAPKDESMLKSWPRYYFDVWTKQQFDYEFIFIDGRFRTACALVTAVCAKDSATIAIHDYTYRSTYFVTEKYFDVIDAADSLVLLRKRKTINMRALVIDLGSNLFDVS